MAAYRWKYFEENEDRPEKPPSYGVTEGYNGSHAWETSFTIQAIISTNLVEEYGPTLRKAHQYIIDSQVLEDCPGDLDFWYHHISKCAWPFSTANHGWPISDCTAEVLKNDDGGFATYELTRSYQWLELINPAETFGDIVIDYPYVECTSAAIQALALFKKLCPGHRSEEIENCIARAAKFIETIQARILVWFLGSMLHLCWVVWNKRVGCCGKDIARLL